MFENRLAAAALAALGAAAAVPAALAQFDFAGVFDAFNIESDDVPVGLTVLAGVSAVLTTLVIGLALTGAALALTQARTARALLLTAAVAGFATATILWIAPGVLLGAAVMLLDRERPA